jgi:riboflavin transporter FmnP
VLLIIAVLTKKNHGLVIGLVLGTLAMAAAMVPLNLFFTVRVFWCAVSGGARYAVAGYRAVQTSSKPG